MSLFWLTYEIQLEYTVEADSKEALLEAARKIRPQHDWGESLDWEIGASKVPDRIAGRAVTHAPEMGLVDGKIVYIEEYHEALAKSRQSPDVTTLCLFCNRSACTCGQTRVADTKEET